MCKHFYFITCNILVIIFVIFGINIVHTLTNSTSDVKPKLDLTFKDYLQQFKPSQVWLDIEQSNKLKGINNNFTAEFEKIMDRIDETDELLKLKVSNGNPKVIVDKDGRRQFVPPGRVPPHAKFDMFRVRNRLVELMKQAIYQARNKMVVMQDLRLKYNKISLYKMGFLMSKTDNACRIFASFAYKSYKMCTLQRQYAMKEYSILHNLEAKERLLDLWFDVDLLVDLVFLNHNNCLRMLNQVVSNRKHAWKFVD